MVWIYGGGFVNGGSSPAVYDGSQFAKHGIVFVSFNYRLGRFGFFAHPALSAGAPGGPLGNYALHGSDRGAEVGEDATSPRSAAIPTNVTMFGESAGGMSVHMLLTSPAAKGLLHKAIIESGGGRSGMLTMRKLHEDTPNGPTSAESVGVAFAKSNGIEGTDAAALDALRKLPADKVVAGLNMATMGAPAPHLRRRPDDRRPDHGRVRRGRVPRRPQREGAAHRRRQQPGHRLLVREEHGRGDGAVRRRTRTRRWRRTIPNKTGDLRSSATRWRWTAMMIEPARFAAKTFAAQGQPTYLYRFSYVAESHARKDRPAHRTPRRSRSSSIR